MQLELVAMLCLTAILIVALLSLFAVLREATRQAGDKEPAILNRLFGQQNGLRLLTVGLVIACATYLTLAGLLNEAIISLFAAVAGFVLGGQRAEPAEARGRSPATGNSPTP